MIKIIRYRHTSTCIHSFIEYNGKTYAGLELPYIDNHPNVSAIPLGTYAAHISDSVSRETRIQLDSVDDRTAIQIHRGNSPSDSRGCMLIGKYADHYHNKVLESQWAFSNFMQSFQQDIDNKQKINLVCTIRDLTSFQYPQ